MSLFVLLLGVGSGWFFLRDDPEALRRALEMGAGSASFSSPVMNTDELEQFRRDVGKLRRRGVREVGEALEMPDGDEGVVSIRLVGYPALDDSEAWEAPMEILAARMIELDPEKTFRQAFWRIKWTDRFSWTYINLLAQRSPDFVWDEIQRIYDEALEYHDQFEIEGFQDWVEPIFFSMESLEGRPGRAFLLSKSYWDKPYSGWLQSRAQMGMLRAAVEEGSVEEFLDWKLSEGSGLVDEWTRSSFKIWTGGESSLVSLALALLAREDPGRAIQWASRHTLELDFDWRAAIASGWVEYFPDERVNIPRYESRREDALNWLLRTVAAGDTGLRNAFWRWNNEQEIEALRWLGEKANSPAAEEVKEALRKEF